MGIGWYFLLYLSWYHNAVDLVNLLRFNLTRMGGYQEQLYVLIYLKDLVFAKFLTLKETITVFTFCVLHRWRYSCFMLVLKWVQMLSTSCACTFKCLLIVFPVNFQERERYKLENPKSFHYLNQTNCYKLDGVNDAEEYLATRRAMDIVGISEEEQVSVCVSFRKWCALAHFTHFIHHLCQEAIFRVVAAILHLGNIEFAKGEEIDSSVIKDQKSRFHLNMTAELLKYNLFIPFMCSGSFCDLYYICWFCSINIE